MHKSPLYCVTILYLAIFGNVLLIYAAISGSALVVSTNDTCCGIKSPMVCGPTSFSLPSLQSSGTMNASFLVPTPPQQQQLHQRQTQDRTNDYEKKYPEDPFGRHLDPNARFWKVYMDEAEKYDSDMLLGFKEIVDSILIFSALFSILVATFVVQASTSLRPDYSQITVTLLHEQIRLLRAGLGGNMTAIERVPASPPDDTSVTHSNLNLWVNALFYISLTISLSAALLAVLSKQWLQAYNSSISGNTKERALVRQLRLTGIVDWKVPEIIGFLPILLHVALALFLCGLSAFVYGLEDVVSAPIITLTCITFMLYIISTILPSIWVRCPYRVAPFFYLTQWSVYAFRSITFGLRSSAHFVTTSIFKEPRLTTPGQLPRFRPTSFGERDRWQVTHDISLDSPLTTLTTAKAISWLFEKSSNLSVRNIAFDAVYGLLWQIPFDFSQNCQNDLRRPPSESVLRSLPISSLITVASESKRSVVQPAIRKAVQVYGSPYYPESRDPSVWSTPLLELAVRCHEDADTISRLLDEIPRNRPYSPDSSLYFAVKVQRLEIVRLLVGHSRVCQALIDHQEGPEGNTPLIEATERRNVQMVELLLRVGQANVNARNRGNGYSAIHYAVRKNSDDIVQLLLNAGADPNCTTNGGSTPLHLAARLGYGSIADLLLSKGANKGARNDEGFTPFLDACWGSKIETVQLLFQAENDAGRARLRQDQASSGRTAIHAVVDGSNSSSEIRPVLEFLLQNGFDSLLNVRNGFGITPLELAMMKNRHPAIQILRGYAAVE